MCLILLAYRQHSTYQLILASNRDEFFARPTARIHRWTDAPIHAGRDLQAGGTWMGVSTRRTWAALTNYRQGKDPITSAPSRGKLVTDFLLSDLTPSDYAHFLQKGADAYNGYNLLLGDAQHIYYQSNRTEQPQEVPAGIHGLSNHLLDTPWPKVERGKAALEKAIQKEELDREDLFALLQNQELAADELLPDTGIPYDWEKALSSMYISLEEYGTRVSSILLQDYDGNIYVEERAHVPVGEPLSFYLTGEK